MRGLSHRVQPTGSQETISPAIKKTRERNRAKDILQTLRVKNPNDPQIKLLLEEFDAINNCFSTTYSPENFGVNDIDLAFIRRSYAQ